MRNTSLSGLPKKRDDSILKILMVGVNSKFIHTNLAVRYIKGYCSGFNVAVKEFTINDSVENMMSGIYDESPDVIGLSCYIWNIEIIYKLCSGLKKLIPNACIILGGPEVSYDGPEIIEEKGYIDYIIKGEGEVSARALFGFLNGNRNDICDVPGVVYRRDGTVEENECAPPISDLDRIPFPYSDEDCSLENRILYYESSRGCPFNCAYCLSSTTKGVRCFSLDRVKKDLMWFIGRDVKLVKFVDRTFNSRADYIEILKFIEDNSKNTRFHFEISADLLGEEALRLLKSAPAGLFQLEAGVQSTNGTTLKAIDRRSDLPRIERNISALTASGNIPLHVDLIAGLPGEGINSFRNSFDEVFALKADMLQLGFLKLLKGSKLRDRAADFGIVYNDFPPYEVLRTDDISYGELLSLKRVEMALDIYYNSGRFAASLDIALQSFESPLRFFLCLGDFIGSVNLSNMEQYRMLYDFCARCANCDKELLRDCVAFDYLEQGRNPVMPDFLKDGTEVDRQRIWDFLGDADNIKKFLPQYAGCEAKNIIRNLHFAYFGEKLAPYIRRESPKTDHMIVIFDYGHRDKNGRILFSAVDDFRQTINSN